MSQSYYFLQITSSESILCVSCHGVCFIKDDQFEASVEYCPCAGKA